MAGRLEEYERLLRDLSVRVDERDRALILKALENVRADLGGERSPADMRLGNPSG